MENIIKNNSTKWYNSKWFNTLFYISYYVHIIVFIYSIIDYAILGGKNYILDIGIPLLIGHLCRPKKKQEIKEVTTNNIEVLNKQLPKDNIIAIEPIKTYTKRVNYNAPTIDLFNDSVVYSDNKIAYSDKIEMLLKELKIDVVSKEIKDSRIATSYIYEYSNLAINSNTFNKLLQGLKCFNENIELHKHFKENTFMIESIKTDESRYVNIKEVLDNVDSSKYELPLYLGINTDNENSVIDLSKAPHILIGGQTGSGKSVAISTIITSLVYHKTPEELDLILIDKKNELSLFNDLPHLKQDNINDNDDILDELYTLESEMRRRQQLISKNGCRNIVEYNSKFANKLKYTVCIIDELQDIFNSDIKKEAERLLNIIASLGRASGIHLIIATQRPSAKLLSGELKANLPTKISLSVSSNVDSRVILDSNGAEKLIGNGDALLKRHNTVKFERLQIANITLDEINRLIDYIK